MQCIQKQYNWQVYRSLIPTVMDIPCSHDLVYTDWTLIEAQFDPEKLRTRETALVPLSEK